MRVLTKPDLDNAILVKELQIIMENFGIKEDHDDDEEEEDARTKEAAESRLSAPEASKGVDSEVNPMADSQPAL